MKPNAIETPIVVATNGSFDLLHVGHISLFTRARQFGHRLVVLVNDDDSVKQLRGQRRPLNCLADRMRLVRSLRCVDEVRSCNGTSVTEVLREIRPNVFVNGADTARRNPEEALVMADWNGISLTLPIIEASSITHANSRAAGFQR